MSYERSYCLIFRVIQFKIVPQTGIEILLNFIQVNLILEKSSSCSRWVIFLTLFLTIFNDYIKCSKLLKLQNNLPRQLWLKNFQLSTKLVLAFFSAQIWYEWYEKVRKYETNYFHYLEESSVACLGTLKFRCINSEDKLMPK